MKILRAFILAGTVLLAALGLGVAFVHPGSFPVVYLKVDVSRSTASLGFVAAGLDALALVLWMSTEFPLVGDRRRLALGLSFANLLIAAEIEGLTIPDKIRQGLLRKIQEAADDDVEI